MCRGRRASSQTFAQLKLKTQLEFMKYIQSLSHYRRENLFLNALIVLAIMGAIFLTCGLSRAACPPAAPPLGAEDRDDPGEGLSWEEEERLDSPE